MKIENSARNAAAKNIKRNQRINIEAASA